MDLLFRRRTVEAIELLDAVLVLEHLRFEHLLQLVRATRQPVSVRAFELHLQTLDLRLPRADTVAGVVEECGTFWRHTVAHACEVTPL